MQMNKKMFKRPIISNFAILPMHKQGRRGGAVPLGPPRHAPPRPPLDRKGEKRKRGKKESKKGK